jgi:hypothetical protein
MPPKIFYRFQGIEAIKINISQTGTIKKPALVRLASCDRMGMFFEKRILQNAIFVK